MDYGIAKEKEMERETVLGRGQWKECRFQGEEDGWRANAREGKMEDKHG